MIVALSGSAAELFSDPCESGFRKPVANKRNSLAPRMVVCCWAQHGTGSDFFEVRRTAICTAGTMTKNGKIAWEELIVLQWAFV
eukprot:3885846-Amphidinium_carterae.1